VIILDGKEVAQARRKQIKARAEVFSEAYGRRASLAVVLVGDDPASQVYVRNKAKGCAEVGLDSIEHKLPVNISRSELIQLVKTLNADDRVDGILVQLPLPKGLDPSEIIDHIDPQKDPDGLTTENMGLLFVGRTRVASCTPAGVMVILEHYRIPVAGRRAVVVGRSQIVGRPMAQLLTEAHATVTVCHSKTPDIREHTSQADLVVVAAGKAGLLGREDFKKGAVVIDVGIHRLPGGKLCGDVRFDELNGWVQAATPVPGGVGPMTITMLLENTLQLAELRAQL